MSAYRSQIEALVGSNPDELVEFYEQNRPPQQKECRINFLSFDEALDSTKSMQGIPVVKLLGLWVLDDANDSNPFCYVGKGPCAGAIIHFSHDDDPRIYYSSLNGCLESMATIAAIEGDIDDAVPEMNLEFQCGTELARLCDDDSNDATFLICLYLPVCSDLEPVVLEKLTSHPDFFVREALAARLLMHPRREDLPFAERLAEDKHSQVATPGKAAQSEINRLSR